MTRSRRADSSCPGASRKCVECSRTRSYAPSSTLNRSVHVGSAHSHTNSASFRPTAVALSAMRSFTSRNSDSVLAIFFSSSPMEQITSEGFGRLRSARGVARAGRARRRLRPGGRCRAAPRGVRGGHADRPRRRRGSGLRPRGHRQVGRVRLRRPRRRRPDPGRPPRGCREGRSPRGRLTSPNRAARRRRGRDGIPAGRGGPVPAADARPSRPDRPAPARAPDRLGRRRQRPAHGRPRAGRAGAPHAGPVGRRGGVDGRVTGTISAQRPGRAETMRETEKIWMNGELVDWADAKVHVGAHGLHYGTGVFEGIRCYETTKGPAVFRLADHMQRLHDSAKLLYMELPYSVEELRASTHELIDANGLPACYIRPIAFYGYGQLGVATTGNPVDVVIMAWPWGTYLGEEALAKGVTATTSSWNRV